MSKAEKWRMNASSTALFSFHRIPKNSRERDSHILCLPLILCFTQIYEIYMYNCMFKKVSCKLAIWWLVKKIEECVLLGNHCKCCVSVSHWMKDQTSDKVWVRILIKFGSEDPTQMIGSVIGRSMQSFWYNNTKGRHHSTLERFHGQQQI